MTTSNENGARPAGRSTDSPATAPQGAPGRHQRTRRLIEPRWQLGIACGVSLLILGSGALYMLGVRLVASERVASALGESLHRVVTAGFDVAYFLGIVAIVHRVVVRMTHSVVGPAFAIERGLRALARGETGARFKLRDGDSLTEVAAAADELALFLDDARTRREAELGRMEEVAGDADAVAAAIERIRAIEERGAGGSADADQHDAADNSGVRLVA